MFPLLCLSLCAASAASAVNTSIFDLEYETPERGDVTYCVRNIIKEIVEHEDFITDVILMNIESVVKIPKLHGLRTRFITRSYSWVHSEVPNRIYVMSCIDFKEFEFVMKQAMQDKHFNCLANFIVVLNNFRDDQHYLKMTHFLASNNIYNVTILSKNENGEDYKIFRFQSPIHPCNQREMLVTISNCLSYEGGQHIFADIGGIQGCSFQFLSHNLFPLINFDNEGEDGIEQTIMRLFETYANIKIELKPYSTIDKLGRVASFHMATMAKVMKSDIEGVVGGYYVSYDVAGSFTYTYPLIVDHIMAIMPRANFLDTWTALFQKALSAVVLFFTLFIVLSLTAHLLSLFPTHHADPVRDTLIVFGYFLNKVTIGKFKPGVPETILACSLLISTFIVPYTMQAYMSSIKTYPVRGYEVKEYSEVLQCCQKFVPSEWKSEEEREESVMYPRECHSRWECLMMVRDWHDKTRYTLMTEEVYEAYKWSLADKHCRLSLYKLKEPVAYMMRTVYLRRGSVFAKPFNEFFVRVMSAGLVQQHYKQILHREKLKCKAQYQPRYIPADMRELKGPLRLLAVGLFVSAITFAYEVITR